MAFVVFFDAGKSRILNDIRECFLTIRDASLEAGPQVPVVSVLISKPNRERHMRKILSIAMIAAFVLPALPVAADPPPWAPAHGRRAKDAERDYRDRDRDDDRGYYVYRDDHRRHARRVVRYDEVVYRGDDGRYYCHRSDGTTGLIVGAVAGGVIGNQLARGKSAALGTILGAGAGALLGQAIDRDRVYCE